MSHRDPRRLRHHVAVAALTTLLAIGLAACGAEATPAPGGPGDPVITIAAVGIAFEGGDVRVPAELAFTIRLENRDDGVPHGLTIMGGPGMATEVVAGAIVVGPGQTDLDVPTGLVAGEYQLICPIHPATMVTGLTVGL